MFGLGDGNFGPGNGDGVGDGEDFGNGFGCGYGQSVPILLWNYDNYV